MLEVEDDNVEVGTIVQEIQTGYMMGDRLLRPSLVGVSRGKIKKRNQKMIKISTLISCTNKITPILLVEIKDNYEQSNWNRSWNYKLLCGYHGWSTG